MHWAIENKKIGRRSITTETLLRVNFESVTRTELDLPKFIYKKRN